MQRDDRIIQLHPDDPIAIAVQDIEPGAVLRTPDGGRLVAADRIPAGHKIALRDLAPGETVLRYGCRIGQASQPIVAGSWVHSHNLEVGAISGGYTCRVVPPLIPTPTGRTFLGYRRPDGRVRDAQLSGGDLVGALCRSRRQPHRPVFHTRAAG